MKKLFILILLLTGVVFFYGNCNNDTTVGACDERSINQSCTEYNSGDAATIEADCSGDYTNEGTCASGSVATCEVGDDKTIYYYDSGNDNATACANSGGTLK